MKYSNVNILFGPPGAGKTFAAEQFAAEAGADLVFYQCHAWTSADDFFVGINVAAAVAGNAEEVRQPGVLVQAAEASRHGLVVLVIDELDKAPESADALLLDFLQSGRAPLGPGRFVQANLDNLVCFIISNQQRPHNEALLRRGKRFWFDPMGADQIAAILEKQGYCKKAAYGVAKLAQKIAGDSYSITLQEVKNFLEDTEGTEDFREFFADFVSWFARNEEVRDRILAAKPRVATLFGKILAEQ